MAAVDSSSPVRFSGQPANGVNITSASFTPPNNSLLVACVSCDTGLNTDTTITVSDSLTGTVDWTNRIEQDEGTDSAPSAGGHASIWTRPVTTGAAMTVSAQHGTGAGGNQMNVKVYVVTSYDTTTPTDSTTVANRGFLTSNAGAGVNTDVTDSVTPGANGLLFVCGSEWNALGTPTSSDLDGEDTPGTEDAFHHGSNLSGLSGYKAVTSGVATTANLNASGTAAASWMWVQLIVRDGAAATRAFPFVSGRAMRPLLVR